MQFRLSLTAIEGKNIPINYQYPLSACIYKIIQRADAGFASFLHNTGYRHGGKTFKLFTFSSLSMACRRVDDRLQLLDGKATLQLAFQVPEAAEKFIMGLFIDQRLELGDRYSRMIFEVSQVESLPVTLPQGLPDNIHSIVFEPISPIVTGPKNEKGHYIFLAPDHADYSHWLRHNLLEKWAATCKQTSVMASQSVNNDALSMPDIDFEILYGQYAPKSRLMTIKAGTPEETRIRGFINFRLQVTAPLEILQLALDSGLGIYNSMGCGMVEVVK